MGRENRGFSVEGAVGMAIALLSLLIDPNRPIFRISILLFSAVLLSVAIRKSHIVQERHPALSLTSGFSENLTRSALREWVGVLFVVILIAAFGLLTWPHDKLEPRLLEGLLSAVPESVGSSAKVPVNIPATLVPVPPVPAPSAENPKPKAKPSVRSKPRLACKTEDEDLLLNISEGNLREKARHASKALNDAYRVWDHKDIVLDDKRNDGRATYKSTQAILGQREQLRVRFITDNQVPVCAAIALKYALQNRFGPTDQQAVDLQSVISKYADMADYINQSQ
jgi:hypothetical protein